MLYGFKIILKLTSMVHYERRWRMTLSESPTLKRISQKAVFIYQIRLKAYFIMSQARHCINGTLTRRADPYEIHRARV